MTLPSRPNSGPSGGDPDAERVLEQALRAMAGGAKQSRPESVGATGREPLTRVQVLLIATIAGLLIGITTGLVSLLV